MVNKIIETWKSKFPKEKELIVASNVKNIHPIVDKIINNLCGIDLIKYLRVSQDQIQASNEIKIKGKVKIPVTTHGHPDTVGIYLLSDFHSRSVQFYEITSTIRGYGDKMVRAVVTAIPDNWEASVVMDYSEGFWERMAEKYKNITII